MDPIVTDDEQIQALRNALISTIKELDSALQIHDFRFVAGATHTNLIFDVAVPFENKLADEEIRRQISDRVSKLDPSYFCVITIDRI